ncbi:MAG: nickel-dependent hydrogenase large subunit, partial [Planctomycetes bacterium]|nr:nickel-dependent hydrogenase large subunit [Planctomycetota bacterium]
ARYRTMLDEIAAFVKDVYIPDVLGFSRGPWLKLARMGLGAGPSSYLACGGFEKDPAGKETVFGAGVVRDFASDRGKVEKLDPNRVTESVARAWYRKSVPRHPADGEQEFDLEREGAYSFVKAPRYDGLAVEVGPLARALVMRNPGVIELVPDGTRPGVVARHAARALETGLMVDACYQWLEQLAEAMTRPGFRIHDTEHWSPPEAGRGAGFMEAPRGALGHWIRIKDGKIENYQAVAPSTWNASPRDERGVRGPYEEALLGAPIPDPDNPLNAVRIVRSFDPCLACAVHLIDPQTNELRKFLVE